MKKINHLISALIMAAMTAGFASCSSSDEPSSVSDNTPKELTLTIMSTKPVTKAALNSAPTDDQEKKINRITVGIFSKDGNTVRTIQEFSEVESDVSTEIAGTNKFYNPTNGSATVKVVTTQLASDDQVLVAINAPAGKFNGILTAQNFKDVTIDAATAIATDATNNVQNQAQPQNIPMFGEVTSLSGSGNSYSANVDVYHLTAKITLSSLKVAFDTSGPYADASFTPTEIFLYSVPDGLKFNYSSPYLTSPTTYYTGETGASGLTVKEYLSSGDITGSALNNSNSTFGTTYYFYTTPNNDVNANKTKLVIKGKFKKNSSDEGTIVYYPVSLNHKVEANGSTGAANSSLKEYQVYPNKDYQCSVTIKTIGSNGPGTDIDPTTATIDITVKEWDVVSQTTVFQ